MIEYIRSSESWTTTRATAKRAGFAAPTWEGATAGLHPASPLVSPETGRRHHGEWRGGRLSGRHGPDYPLLSIRFGTTIESGVRVGTPQGETMNLSSRTPAILAGIAVLASASAAAPAMAQQDASADTIVVTATRSEIPLSDTIVPVTVIDRERIELATATDLAELLRFEAGIDIGRNGGPGQATSVFLRGTESNHTLVLVDGVRINPGTIGGAALQHIDPRVIERIEIVKGTRSSLFGTDAIGGVINIVTRRAASPYADAGVGAGSFSQRTGYLSAGTAGDRYEAGLTVNARRTDGFPVRTDSDLARGYDNLSASLHAARKFDGGGLAFRHWRATGNVEYLDFFLSPLDQDYLNESSAIELENTVFGEGRSKLILSHSRDRIEQNQSIDSVESDRVSLDWQFAMPVGAHRLMAGVFASEETAQTASSFGSGFHQDTGYRALFLQDSLSAGRHRAFFAARYTDYDSFGNELTWNAEYGVELGEHLRLNAGLGHGFRAPDATDRFGFGGNPALLPEATDEAQLGAELRLNDRHRISLELYASDIDDLIEFDLASFTLQNIARAEIRGAELGWQYDGERYLVRSTLVSQRADNATTGDRLLRRAEESLTVNVERRFGEHRVGLSVLATGDREDFAESLAGYTLVNLSGVFRLGNRWQLNTRIENLFDENYTTAAGFRMQERSWFAELSYRYR